MPGPTPKQLFVQWCLTQLGRPVLMSAKGDFYVDPKGTIIKLPAGVLAFDCSGLVSCGIEAVLPAKKLRADHSAQKYWAEAEPFLVVHPEPGDLGFYGVDPDHVVHIVVATVNGLISADGATKSISTLPDAIKNPMCRVRFHSGVDYRHDVPFLGWRRNLYFPAP